ncbi:hypothetical protein KLVAMA180M_05925 [Klebsiella variicola subsp. variicola]|uniref:hypothetical protein n=1 Tax=Klebsiella variicola TaxID=244366 RepID=UPI003B27A959
MPSKFNIARFTDEELAHFAFYAGEAIYHPDPNYRLEFDRLAYPGAIFSLIHELQERRRAAMDSEPVIADCDPEVYEKGASACLVAIPKETAEVICKGISAVTGCKIDWHYIGGRVNIKALRLSPQPAPEYPETLPCPVLLEPGLRFGKGIKTSTMLAALARRDVYESDLAALSPEERAEFQVGIEDVKALIAQSTPVMPDGYVMVPKDLLSELRDLAHPEIEKYCEMWEGRRDSEFPALRKVITDADALLAAAPQEVKGE